MIGSLLLGILSGFDESIMENYDMPFPILAVCFWPLTLVIMLSMGSYILAQRATLQIRSTFK